MFKRISVLLLTALMIAGLGSCSMPQDIFTDDMGVRKKETQVGKDSAIYEFEFTLDGHNYYLPADYKHFADQGWSISKPEAESDAEQTEAEPQVLAPGEYSDYINIYKNDYVISARFYNADEEEAAIEKCRVVGLEMDSQANIVPYLQMDGDIKFGNSYESVIDQYGKPSFEKLYYLDTGTLASINGVCFLPGMDTHPESPNGMIKEIFYYEDEVTYVMFKFVDMTGFDPGVGKVIMENTFEAEEEYDFEEALSDVPDVIALYNDPALLGTTIEDYAFKYEGDLYTLPMPVAEIVNDGWEIVRGGSKTVLVGYTVDGIVLRKGNIFAKIMVHNYDTESAQNVINCYAVSMSTGLTDTYANIMLPQGITLGSSEAQLKKLYRLSAENTNVDKEDAKVILELDETDEYIIYSYVYPDYVPTVPIPEKYKRITDRNESLLGKHRKRIDFYINKQTGKIVNIYLQNAPEYILDEVKIWEEYIEAQQNSEAEQ